MLTAALLVRSTLTLSLPPGPKANPNPDITSQVKKLSWEDGGLYHRQLYMRNVGSTVALAAHDGLLDGDLPPPSRVAGDIIRFNRCDAG